MEATWQFPRQYEAIPRNESTGLETDSVRWFPEISKSAGRDGVSIRIVPNEGPEWIGRFAFFDPSGKSPTLMLSCPNPRQLCVVSSGAGYIVQTDEPVKWLPIECTPVRVARAALAEGLLLFADFTKLVAYDESGLKWQSLDVSYDGIEIIELADGRVVIGGWDSPKQRHTRVTIDLTDGTVVNHTLTA
jgi:hypothetical protein